MAGRGRLRYHRHRRAMFPPVREVHLVGEYRLGSEGREPLVQQLLHRRVVLERPQQELREEEAPGAQPQGLQVCPDP